MSELCEDERRHGHHGGEIAGAAKDRATRAVPDIPSARWATLSFSRSFPPASISRIPRIPVDRLDVLYFHYFFTVTYSQPACSTHVLLPASQHLFPENLKFLSQATKATAQAHTYAAGWQRRQCTPFVLRSTRSRRSLWCVGVRTLCVGGRSAEIGASGHVASPYPLAPERHCSVRDPGLCEFHRRVDTAIALTTMSPLSTPATCGWQGSGQFSPKARATSSPGSRSSSPRSCSCKPSLRAAVFSVTHTRCNSTSLALPIALYYILLNVLPQQLNRFEEGNGRFFVTDDRFWQARAASLGAFFGLLLLGWLPFFLWKAHVSSHPAFSAQRIADDHGAISRASVRSTRCSQSSARRMLPSREPRCLSGR